jgi:nucleoside-diphosphate-sugar epimerase
VTAHFTPMNRTREALLRVVADAGLLTATLTTALAVGAAAGWALPSGRVGPGLVGALGPSIALLLPVGIGLFALHGFYTRGRFYTTRYKSLVILQTVTLAWLSFYFLQTALLGTDLGLPVYLVGFVLSLLSVGGARLWMALWRSAAPAEPKHAAAARTGDGRRVLVIGGAGYIGSALLPRLLAEGYRVRLLDAFLYSEDPIREVLDHPGLELQRGDFRSVDAVVRACRDMDVVIHLGGIVGDPACSVDQQLTIDVNLSATRMIAEVAQGMGVRRLVFASTCSVYGASDAILDEKSTLNPVSLYARTKLASERVLLDLHERSPNAMAVTILRFSTIFGFSGRLRFDLVVNLLTAQAVNNRSITVKGGDQWRPFVHVYDAAESVLLAVKAPVEVIDGEIFSVGSNANNHTIREVGQIVHSLVPQAELLDLPADGDRRNYRVNFDKIERKLGFRAAWSVQQGVQQVITALTSGRISNWQDSRYNNYRSLADGQVDLRRREEWEDAYLKATLPQPAGAGR